MYLAYIKETLNFPITWIANMVKRNEFFLNAHILIKIIEEQIKKN